MPAGAEPPAPAPLEPGPDGEAVGLAQASGLRPCRGLRRAEKSLRLPLLFGFISRRRQKISPEAVSEEISIRLQYVRVFKACVKLFDVVFKGLGILLLELRP